jgi:hypothetical protein
MISALKARWPLGVQDFEFRRAKRFFDLNEKTVQGGLIRQMTVGHHPQVTRIAQYRSCSGNKRLPKRWVATPADMKRRVHHHGIDRI